MACGRTTCVTTPSSAVLDAFPSPAAERYRHFCRALPRRAGEFVRSYARRHQRFALSELDDRLLADIGVTRREALCEASQPFWRPWKHDRFEVWRW